MRILTEVLWRKFPFLLVVKSRNSHSTRNVHILACQSNGFQGALHEHGDITIDHEITNLKFMKDQASLAMGITTFVISTS